MSWMDTAARIASKGSTAAKARRLGELHARRRATGAQFFTGQWVAAGIWAVLEGVCKNAREDGRVLSVIDTSVGNGRLLAEAPSDVCEFFGIDIDSRCIDALCADADAARVNFNFETGRIEDLRIDRFDIACINPPFSINLQSPLMLPYDCCSYGTYGPKTSALSHEYALAQALDGAAIVAALLPISMLDHCRQSDRLCAIYRLPSDAFADEHANVRTAVFLFGHDTNVSAVLDVSVSEESEWPSPVVSLPPRAGAPRFQLGAINESEPTIHLPVTGDRSVRVAHHNRRLVLHFGCGLTQAKVLNGIYGADVPPVEKHRYPKGMKYRGQARLWLDVMLLQKDPQSAFDELLEQIREHGGEPVLSPTLVGYWRKLKRRHLRAITPFRHWVKTAGNAPLIAEASRSSLLIDGKITGPAIRRGERLTVRPMGGEFAITKDGHEVVLGRDDFERRFKLIAGDERARGDWELIEAGLIAAFPELAADAAARIRRAGIDWLWPFQHDGLIELLLRRDGAIAAWKQGTGKARLAIALALVSGAKNLVVVESCLLNEMRRELEKLKLDPSLWRIIDRCDDPRTMEIRKINIVSYNTLKRSLGGRRTVAKCLRRRFHTVIADEGGILANLHSQQSRALLALAPRKLIVSDGTPIPSYPRSIFPVAAACAGSATAHQPFGIHDGPFLEQRLFTSASYCMRGMDEFRERHVVLEWVTNQFKNDLSNGAKREIPRIARLGEFRRWLQPLVQRKLRDEPEVAPYAGCPKPIYETTTIGWDRGHLKHYLNIALHFAQWYVNHADTARREGRQTNLVAILARIQAVMMAASCPHKPAKHAFGIYAPLTSKQRVAIEKIEKNIADGKKTLLYAYSPSVVERLARELADRGIESVVFHGGIPINRRTQDLDERFRFGPVKVLLSTWCGQKGLNIPQAKRVILYDRNWVGRAEDQAVHRTQRPDQDERVLVDRLHIRGSIDEYMAQVVEWKEAAADAGLDWGDGATESEVFKHLDSIIEEFCRDTLALSSREAFEALAA